MLSRERLLSHVWGYDFDPGSNVVDVYVRYLRKKLRSRRIETLRGAGYRLVETFDQNIEDGLKGSHPALLLV